MSKIYITTPIYYVNDKPHIGHAYSSIIADIFKRFNISYNNYEVFLSTGTDEHGQKIAKSAQKNNISEQEFCNKISQNFLQLADFLNISYDNFIRTTSGKHKKIVSYIFDKLYDNGYIYKDIYKGYYSISDEAFYQKKELIDGKAPTGSEVTWQEEECYFFKLNIFQDILIKLYEEYDDLISPAHYRNEILSFLRGGREYVKDHLKDLCITRTSFNWGVKLSKNYNTNNINHVIYVWLDALFNYFSTLDFDIDNNQISIISSNISDDNLFAKFWQNGKKIHIIGKDISRFHAIYWPAFLIAINYNINDLNKDNINKYKNIIFNKLFIHGWWLNDGQKISKSIGNIIDPLKEIDKITNHIDPIIVNQNNKDILQKIAIDYFRYFLSFHIKFGYDGSYNFNKLSIIINSNLANNIGNLTQRSLSMIKKNLNSSIIFNSTYLENDLFYQAKIIIEKIKKNIYNLDYDIALNEINIFSNKINEFFDHNKPWILRKENKIEDMKEILFIVSKMIIIISLLLQPFIPYLANHLLKLFINNNIKYQLSDINNIFTDDVNINNLHIIFPKIC